MKNKLLGLPDFNLNNTNIVLFLNSATEVSFRKKNIKQHSYKDFMVFCFFIWLVVRDCLFILIPIHDPNYF